MEQLGKPRVMSGTRRLCSSREQWELLQKQPGGPINALCTAGSRKGLGHVIWILKEKVIPEGQKAREAPGSRSLG